MSSPSPAERIRFIIDRVVMPFLGSDGRRPLPRTPAEALAVLDEVEDLEIRGADLAQVPELARHGSLLEDLVRDGDRLVKTGRRLDFALTGERRVELPGSGLNLFVEGPFTLEFRAGDERFPDALAAEQWTKDLDELRSMAEGAPDTWLAAAVLPMSRKLLGIKTPFNAEFMGFRLSLRFLAARLGGDRPRVFVVSPTIRELTR